MDIIKLKFVLKSWIYYLIQKKVIIYIVIITNFTKSVLFWMSYFYNNIIYTVHLDG